MELKELQEYDVKEAEKGEELFWRNKEKSNISLLDFYPEFKEKLNEQTYTRFIARGELAAQFPFFDKIIMPIGTYGDSEILFKWYYGISIDQTIELVKEGKIIPVLKYQPEAYENIDYLDPILEKNPPCETIRNHFIDYYFSSNSLPPVNYKGELTFHALGYKEKFASDAVELLKKGSKLERDNMFWMIMTLHIFRDIPIKLYNIDYIFISAYSQLKSIGYGDLVRNLSNLSYLTDTFAGLCAYSSILYSGLRESLGGIQTWSPQEIEMAKHVCLKSPKKFENEVGKKLIEFKLPDIKYIDYDDIINGSKTKESMKARISLMKLDKAIGMKKDTEDLLDLSKDVQETWEGTTETIRSMLSRWSKLKILFKKNFIPVGLGICGGISAGIVGLHGIIGHAVGHLAGHKVGEVIKPSSDLDIRLLKSSHLVVIPGQLDLQQKTATYFYFRGIKKHSF